MFLATFLATLAVPKVVFGLCTDPPGGNGSLVMAESFCASGCMKDPQCSSYLWKPETDADGFDCVFLNKYQDDFMTEQLNTG